MIAVWVLPLQVVAEAAHWLMNADWANYDALGLLPNLVSAAQSSQEGSGIGVLATWASDIWIAFPVAAVALFAAMVHGAFAAILRDRK